MTLLSRIISERRIPITVIGLALVAGVLLYGLAVLPLDIRADEARERRGEAARALATAQQDYDRARAAADGKTSATENLQRFYRDVLPTGLVGARSITYPRLASLARTHGLVLERRSSVPERDDGSSLARLRTTMLLAGAWPNIRQFIHALENASEFIVIEDIALSQSEDPDGLLVLTLGVATYYQVESGP